MAAVLVCPLPSHCFIISCFCTMNLILPFVCIWISSWSCSSSCFHIFWHLLHFGFEFGFGLHSGLDLLLYWYCTAAWFWTLISVCVLDCVCLCVFLKTSAHGSSSHIWVCHVATSFGWHQLHLSWCFFTSYLRALVRTMLSIKLFKCFKQHINYDWSNTLK